MKQGLFWVIILGLLAFRVGLYKNAFSRIEGRVVKISGRIWREPDYYQYGQRVTVRDIRLSLPRYPEVNYGDWVEAVGTIEDRQIKKPSDLKVSPSDFFYFRLRARVVDFFAHTFPTPDASLVSGMVLGSKKGMPESFWDQLVNTGTAHVVVASGMNVSLVSGFVMAILLKLFERRRAVVFAFISIWLYILLSGFDAPLVRAGVMGSILFFAEFTGRVAATMRVLILTACLMIIVSPASVGDLGFILSFAATASLILFSKKVTSALARVPGIFRESLATSLAAQVGVAPVLYVAFGRVNVFSPLINALILWTVPIITMGGFLAGFVSIFSPQIAYIPAITLLPLTRAFVFSIRLLG